MVGEIESFDLDNFTFTSCGKNYFSVYRLNLTLGGRIVFFLYYPFEMWQQTIGTLT